MERFQRIVKSKRYQEEYEKLQNLEKERRFCRHDMEHFLSVARICYIFAMEKKIDVSVDIIYGTAFLHDLGRAMQYEKGISHEEAGAIIAEEILLECDYKPWERTIIIETIRNHRDIGRVNEEDFSEIFYRADKLSRDCMHCPVHEECYWPPEKKNNVYIR
ncbi:HD domain-containing protein [Anaerostipes sp. MSJ-23]|uniref:HD domain-containing protein n=1 Tax=Anaerostipes sp. MSJ-23 TaxID=2841520 RepID=UPI001C11E206|nr:HD domain-containing protein [Anaerostipes sp. MSJ-23]MBU5459725.1 HD domain-containing protein [Anaerostipes sp. MSJ-23]